MLHPPTLPKQSKFGLNKLYNVDLAVGSLNKRH